MHFWIDKRSSYGIGHNRSMAGLSYQHRRIRSKSIVTPVRHVPPSVPSTSQHHAKSHHLNHHRNRHADFDHRPPTRIQHHTTSESSPSSSNSVGLNHQHVPVIHSVYSRDELPVNHVVESSESTRSFNVFNHWTMFFKIGFQALFLLFILVALKFCINNELTAPQLIFFGFISFAFFILISVLRMRKNLFDQTVQSELMTETIVEPVINNQMTAQSQSSETIEPPPPYAVAVKLPEKQTALYLGEESPPPSYEKISII